MTAYAALLRGIGPSNPNMRNEKLREMFEALGFADVASVLSSGNIVFSTDEATDIPALEDKIQAGLQDQLGIPGGTIVRTADELQALVETEPFGDREHGPSAYLTATFLKHPLEPVPVEAPDPQMPSVQILGYDAAARAVLAVSDNTATKTPDLMGWLERQFTKDITTRTWLTVHRILRKMLLS